MHDDAIVVEISINGGNVVGTHVLENLVRFSQGIEETSQALKGCIRVTLHVKERELYSQLLMVRIFKVYTVLLDSSSDLDIYVMQSTTIGVE